VTPFQLRPALRAGFNAEKNGEPFYTKLSTRLLMEAARANGPEPPWLTLARSAKTSITMPLSFWIKRFMTVFLGAFAVLLVVGILKGRALATAAPESALWAGIAATIFLSTRIYRSRKGQHCELCRDTPQTREGEACPIKKPDSSP
jgi:hypothetical protein